MAGRGSAAICWGSGSWSEDRRLSGRITAAGGAWNASIVAELVTWHHNTLHAYGLGNYIATASIQGKFALLIAGGIVMSAFVVLVNRLFWRRLYAMAERRFTL